MAWPFLLFGSLVFDRLHGQIGANGLCWQSIRESSPATLGGGKLAPMERPDSEGTSPLRSLTRIGWVRDLSLKGTVGSSGQMWLESTIVQLSRTREPNFLFGVGA
jgi:hypothetical protein